MECRAELLDLLFHDLRTPLTIIRGRTQLIRRRLPAATEIDQIASYLGAIEAAASRTARLLDDLHQVVCGVDQRVAPLRRRPIDLVELARRCADELGREYAGTSRIAVLPDQTRLIILGDPARLEHMLVNLLGNALKYSPDGRPVTVTLTRESDFAVVRVSDQGVGIPAPELPRVFEQFYRASNVSGQVPGTGIGLAGVRQIVESHGGSITIDSQEHVGTTVTVRLPLRRAQGRLPRSSAD